MAWVDGSGIKGGGTEFPALPVPASEEWCRFVECGGNSTGAVFKVTPGNAVYWENFAADGRGYDETWHAGLPVEEGTKVGLNIWSFGRI